MRFVTCFLFCVFSTLSISPAAATDNFVHFVRVHRPMVLRDRTGVPAGGDIAVKYDAGNGWIPYFVVSLPFIPKSAATPVEEVVFDTPIEGVARRLTAYYRRLQIRNSIAFGVAPNATGAVLSKGATVKITRREGGYYLISTWAFPFAMVPVGAIKVDRSALATGRVVPIPRQSASDIQPVSHPPQPGRLYGRLKVPYMLDGKALPAGSYVSVDYDGGDSWILGGQVYVDPPRISKAAVDLVPRVNFYVALVGRIRSPTTVYKLLPDLMRNPGSLEQSQIFANMNPSVRVGDEVYITGREGSDYLIQLEKGMRQPGRVPTSKIEIVSGNLNSGTPIIIGPKPQYADPSAPGYVALEKSWIDRLVEDLRMPLAIQIVALVLLDLLIHLLSPKTAPPTKFNPNVPTYNPIDNRRRDLLDAMSSAKNWSVGASVIALAASFFPIAYLLLIPCLMFVVVADLGWLSSWLKLSMTRSKPPPLPPPASRAGPFDNFKPPNFPR